MSFFTKTKPNCRIASSEERRSFHRVVSVLSLFTTTQVLLRPNGVSAARRRLRLQ